MLIATISVDNRNLFRGFGPVLAAAWPGRVRRHVFQDFGIPLGLIC